MPTVTYNPDREKPSRNSTLTLNGVYLQPGVNKVSEEDLQKILAYDDIGYYKKLGAIELPEEIDLRSFIPESTQPTETLKTRKSREKNIPLVNEQQPPTDKE
jgi:hypothetical protein